MSLIYPELSDEDALSILEELEETVRAGGQPKSLPDGSLDPRTRFSGFGGAPVHLGRLREMHSSLSAVVARITSSGRDADRRFDIEVGSFLVDWFEKDGRSQASNPRIWAYLAIVVLPDIALRRFGLNGKGKLPRERFLAGRRNVFYRAYLRSWILGDLLDDPDLPLFEDELVGLVDRNLSADHLVARLISEQIRSAPVEAKRREWVRNGLKSVQYELRVTDISSMGEDAARDTIERAFASS